MTVRVIRYSVGNEHNPGDPWGRSELTIQADGTAQLDHHFSRAARVGAWTGQVSPEALDAFWAGLERAGFPATSQATFVPGATLRHLTVEDDGASQSAIVDWHGAAKQAGYAEAFDVLDGVIRQLSGEAVPYPSSQPPIVSNITDHSR